MINILMNQKPGLIDSVSCPTIEIPALQISRREKTQTDNEARTLRKHTASRASMHPTTGGHSATQPLLKLRNVHKVQTAQKFDSKNTIQIVTQQEYCL